MIPFDPTIFLIMAIISMIAFVTPFLILYSLLFSLRVYFIARKEKVPFIRLLFKSRFFITVFVITLIFTGITASTNYKERAFHEDFTTRQEYQQQRQNFLLEHDHFYGEFLFPKGSLINRYDPNDNGDEIYPLILSGLRTAEFPESIEIAGILGTKVDARGYIELAEDQMVGPPHYYSSKTGEWIEDRTFPFMACEKGSIAMYEKPSDLNFDWDKEDWWRARDGKDAYFKPSEWQFRDCHQNREIEILPAYGTKEAVAREETIAKEARQEKPETIIKNGVLMDAQEIVFSFSYFLEALQQYNFVAKRNQLAEDYLKAYELFEQAVNNEEEEAYYYLGIMNYAGEGVPKDRERALYWLNKSVDAGYVDAIATIGSIYLNDEEVQDYPKAMELFQKVLEKKRNEVAEFYIGVMYAQGLGVEQDYQQALEWFKKSADPFHAIGMTGYHPLALRAMLNIGKLYEEGFVGEKNLISAEPWYDKACHLELQEACRKLSEVDLVKLK